MLSFAPNVSGKHLRITEGILAIAAERAACCLKVVILVLIAFQFFLHQCGAFEGRSTLFVYLVVITAALGKLWIAVEKYSAEHPSPKKASESQPSAPVASSSPSASDPPSTPPPKEEARRGRCDTPRKRLRVRSKLVNGKWEPIASKAAVAAPTEAQAETEAEVAASAQADQSAEVAV